MNPTKTQMKTKFQKPKQKNTEIKYVKQKLRIKLRRMLSAGCQPKRYQQ